MGKPPEYGRDQESPDGVLAGAHHEEPTAEKSDLDEARELAASNIELKTFRKLTRHVGNARARERRRESSESWHQTMQDVVIIVATALPAPLTFFTAWSLQVPWQVAVTATGAAAASASATSAYRYWRRRRPAQPSAGTDSVAQG